MTKRGYGGMIVMGSEGEPQQLLVIGGQAPISTITQYHHQFKYIKMPSYDDRVKTNEQNIYHLSIGKWSTIYKQLQNIDQLALSVFIEF